MDRFNILEKFLAEFFGISSSFLCMSVCVYVYVGSGLRSNPGTHDAKQASYHGATPPGPVVSLFWSKVANRRDDVQ